MLGLSRIQMKLREAFGRPVRALSATLSLEQSSFPQNSLAYGRDLHGEVIRQVDAILSRTPLEDPALRTACEATRSALMALAAAPPDGNAYLQELVAHFRVRQPLARLFTDKEFAGALIEKLERRTKSIGDVARISYLKAAIARKAAGGSQPAGGVEAGLNTLAWRAKNGPYAGEVLPLGMERFKTFLSRINVDLNSVPPEVVRIIDDSNMLYARLVLGQARVDSPFCRSFSALLFCNGAAGEREQERAGAGILPPAPAGPAARRVWLDSGEEPFKQFLRLGVREQTGSFDDALAAACRTVFSVMPPLREERLYALAACAVLAHELGLESIELGPKSSGLSSLEAVALHMDKNKVNPELASAIGSWQPADQFILSFLLSQLSDEAQRGNRAFNASGIGRQVYAFFEKIAERPCGFEDLFGAAVLSRELFRVRIAPAESCAAEKLAGTYELPLFYHLSNFKAGYLNDRDLAECGITGKRLRKRILFKVRQAEHLGLVANRADALTCAELLANAGGQQFRLSAGLCSRSGAELEKFIRVQRHKAEELSGYRLIRYYSLCRQQFPQADSDLVQQELNSGNYPELNMEMSYCGVNPEQIAAALAGGKLRNLVELESFCKGLRILREKFPGTTVTLRNTLDSAGSAGTFALIERPHDKELPSIALCIGYQGENHVGEGFRHLIHQRMQDGSLQAFRQAGENDDQALGRFLEEAVFYVAGTARAKVPSRIYPKTHTLLSGAVKGNAGHYLTLVLARNSDPLNRELEKVQVVTALYHTSARALRACLKREMKGWVEHEVPQRKEAGLQELSAQLAAVLKEVNVLLGRAAQPALQHTEIGAAGLQRIELPARTLGQLETPESAPPTRARAPGGGVKFNAVGGAPISGARAAAAAPARAGAPAGAAAVTFKAVRAIEEEIPDYDLGGAGLIFQPQLAELMK